VKPEYGRSLSKQTYDQVVAHFEKLLKVLHPFMPFITEEIWHLLKNREEKDCIMISSWPKEEKVTNSAEEFKGVKDLIVELRNVRKSKNIPFKEKLSLKVRGEAAENRFNPIVKKLCNLDDIESTIAEVENSISFLVDGIEYFVPLAGQIDVEAEKEKIQADIDYQMGFLKSVEKKLANENFVSNAPEKVVEMERKKKADAEKNIELLKKQLAAF